LVGPSLSLTSFLTCLLSLPAWAKADPASTVVADEASVAAVHEEIVVTATRGERGAASLPVSATIIDSEAIELAPVSQLDELLRQAPGVQLPATPGVALGPTQTLVAMRGVGPRSALVLLDGIPLNEAFAAAVTWSKVPLLGVGSVEIVRGAGTSVWGNLAAGGVINVLTRPIAGRDLRAEGSYGSHESWHGAIAAATRAGAWGGSLTADSFSTAGWLRSLPEESGSIDVPADFESSSAQLKVERGGGERSTAWVRGAFYDDDRSGGTELARRRQELFDLAAGASWRLPHDGELFASAYRSDGDREIENTSTVPGRRREAEFVSGRAGDDSRESGAALQWSRSLGARWALLSAGLDLRTVSAEETVSNFDLAGASLPPNAFGGEQASAGLFAQASVFPTADLELLVAARFDRWRNQDGFELLSNGTLVHHPDREESQIDPRLALRYQPRPDFGLRAAAYRAFRAPVLQELYRPFRNPRAAQIPNPALGPEIVVGGEAGVDWSGGRWRSELTVYSNEVEGSIGPIILATSPLLLSQPVNLGSTRTSGAETILRYRFGAHLDLDAAYTYNDSAIRSNPADPTVIGNAVPGVPRHAAQLGVTYRDRRGVTLTLRGRHLGERFDDVGNTLALDAHTILDAAVHWNLTPALAVFARGENLTDELYVADLRQMRLRGAPRQLALGARFTLVPATRRGT
jgi:outer membrane receptor protein involved in Fe transport